MVKTRQKTRQEDKWQQEYLFARPSDDELKQLRKDFVSSKPPRRLRQQPKLKAPTIRKAVSPAMAKRIYEMHFNLQYSFKKIGQLLYCPATTAFMALRRYLRSNGEFVDKRRYNGKNNGRLKIVPRISRHLLDPKVL